MRQEDAFEAQVRQCHADVSAHLPAIARRHSPLALLAALAEHVGGSLQLFMQRGSCTPDQARGVLDRMQQIAFEEADAAKAGRNS